MKLSGRIEKVVYRNSENGYTILEVFSKGVFVTVSGKFPIVGVGEDVELEGDYQINPRYGKQFVAESIKTFKPTDKAAIVKYLSCGLITGVGEVTANNIVRKFGEETLNIIE